MTRPHLLDHRFQTTAEEIAAPLEAGTTHGAPVALATFFAAWIGIGLIQAWILAGRGHDAVTMGVVGAGLGPLMTPVTIDTIRHREREVGPTVIERGITGGGGLDVLVVLEGQPDATQQLNVTLEALSAELGRVTIAKVIAFEWVEAEESNPVLQRAESDLRAAAAHLPAVAPALVVLPGHRTHSITRFASRHGIRLVLYARDHRDDW